MTLAVRLAYVVVSPIVIDGVATRCWSVARGKRWYTPRTDHSCQYLIRMGRPHQSVPPAWVALDGLPVLPATAMVLWKPQADPGAAAVVTVILAGAWYLVHFVVAKERVTT